MTFSGVTYQNMTRLLICLLISSTAAWALTPPTALTVVSATNRQVQLTWQAGGTEANQYVIERRTLDSTAYAPIFTVTPDVNKLLATAFTDAAFDPFTAYLYRVRAVNVAVIPTDTSDPTNEVTVGPPPYGYTRVVATPDNLDDPSGSGTNTQIVLDRSGDPMLSYLNVDPNRDNNFSDTEIRFVRWDRAHYTWTAPVRVAIAGDIDNSYSYNYSSRPAVDASTGTVGIVFIDKSKSTPQVVLADSTDNGATWRTRPIAANSDYSYSVPALALGGGNVYATFIKEAEGIRYMTGKLTDSPSGWSSELVPSLGYSAYGIDADIALDSAGKPGIAYIMLGDDAQRTVFYRPGTTPIVANTTTFGPGDEWTLRLTFAGTSPRIAFAGTMDDNFFADYDHLIFVMTSSGAGQTWNPIVNVRSDGNQFLTGPLGLSLDSSDRAAITMGDNGGNDGGTVCGQPKLSLSSDLRNWSTCGISATLVTHTGTSDVKFAFNDTLYMTFTVNNYPFDPDSPNELAAGVYFWRGPIGFQFPTAPPAQ